MAKCSRCGRIWNGLAECHCSECCRHFKSLSGFDKHRINDLVEGRRCMTDEELIRPSAKTGKPKLVKSGDIWVTGLHENRSDLPSPLKNPAFSGDDTIGRALESGKQLKPCGVKERD